jgi:lipopolysaccharide transport system permease protein
MNSLAMAAWDYRNFISGSIKNKLAAHFSRSILGGFWVILHPLVQVAIYALILSAVLASKLPGIEGKFAYAVYLCAGMLAWNLFSDIISQSLNIFIENGNLLKKIYFPKITLPLIMIGTCVVNNLILFFAIVVVFSVLGHDLSIYLLLYPLIMLVVVIFALGLGLILGILNVFVRDIGQVTPIILQIGFWFTPIVYPVSIVPEELRLWLQFNPMYHIVSAYQSILVYLNAPNIQVLVYLVLFSLLMFVFGFNLFRKAQAEIVDVL